MTKKVKRAAHVQLSDRMRPISREEAKARALASYDRAEARSRAARKGARTRKRNSQEAGDPGERQKTMITIPKVLWLRARAEIDKNFSRAIRVALNSYFENNERMADRERFDLLEMKVSRLEADLLLLQRENENGRA